jgi:hypothetical protein
MLSELSKDNPRSENNYTHSKFNFLFLKLKLLEKTLQSNILQKIKLKKIESASQNNWESLPVK